MIGTETSIPSPLWDFSLKFYRRPGVADACIALQDTCGVDVNVLLFLLWQASQRRRLAADDIKAVAEKSRSWQHGVIAPIRAVRRLLKTDAPLVAPAAATAFRDKIKAIELETEKLQQDALYALAQSLPPAETAAPQDAARENLREFEALAARRFPPSSVETFLHAMKEVLDGK